MSTIYYQAIAHPMAEQLESYVTTAVNNSRLQGINNDINKARSDNSFERSKDLIQNLTYGTIKTDTNFK
jgi:hypothetical protein